MILHNTLYWFYASLFLLSCQNGKLTTLSDLPSDLKEISAAEMVGGTLWTIEDQGNPEKVYGFDAINGKLTKTITVENAKNDDWEDLTSDAEGNLYIGDFGGNKSKRNHFTIYKITTINSVAEKASATAINFTVPKEVKNRDFESFFLLNNTFYIFNKDNKKGYLIKVPNRPGDFEAEIVTNFNLEGKDNAITSAAINADGTKVVLLNHDKLWVLTNFKGDDFFSGKKESFSFEHNSQKEGVCFINDKKVIITDESNGNEGANIYLFELR